MRRLTRREVVGGLAAGGLAGCEAPSSGTRAGGRSRTPQVPAVTTVGGETTTPIRPNILYLYADQFRWDALSCAGMPALHTPFLDDLAASAVRFADCITASPVCLPARAAMMSGKLPSQMRVLTNAGHPDLDGPSHVRRLRDEAGYHTGVIGKVHLHHGRGHKDRWLDRMDRVGFADAIELSGLRLLARFPNAWSDWLSEGSPPDGPDRYDVFQDFMRFYEHHAHVNGEWRARRWDHPRWGLQPDEHPAVFIADTAAAWVTEAAGAAPWYLQVNFPGPHPPWDAPAPWADRYHPETAGLPVPEDRDPGEPWSELTAILRSSWTMPSTDADRRQLVAKYFSRVAMVDEMVGRVIQALADSGQLDDTWIVFGADHGELMGDKNLVGKIAFFDGAVRIPLIVRPPGGAVPWTAEGWCDQLDVTATLLELGGLRHDVALGRSLVDPVLAGPGSFVGKPAVASEIADYSMVVDERYKVVVHRDTMRAVELYDRDADPDEWENRVDDPALAGVQRGGVELLAGLLDGELG